MLINPKLEIRERETAKVDHARVEVEVVSKSRLISVYYNLKQESKHTVICDRYSQKRTQDSSNYLQVVVGLGRGVAQFSAVAQDDKASGLVAPLANSVTYSPALSFSASPRTLNPGGRRQKTSCCICPCWCTGMPG